MSKGAMVTGGIVEYDPSDRTYLLPPEHALFLTRSADINMAATMQLFHQMYQTCHGTSGTN
ncbi:hypothetical protein CEN41_23215 [Fischerella thermalis CCMEE 5330]|uniref:S-adenosylmethionine-dependent methyltransferase Rv2258c-like winged HTH domain-containing protein n=1 Tax=Fischerella thermalis CCMEE 5330 TaxID=2019670 RepID=A0A2N6LW19_9CYAN|nr:hypothetical protein CEN41_23215 [Fischerella thermalis CCMEE 5330]